MNEEQRQRFLDEIEAVCRKHGLAISHQDQQGAFVLVRFDEDVMRWLLDADDLTEFCPEVDKGE